LKIRSPAQIGAGLAQIWCGHAHTVPRHEGYDDFCQTKS
jgi:hypothetical protein